MSGRDVAIYSPASAPMFQTGGGGSLGGGAELQMAFLAGELAARGLRTALIVWPLSQQIAVPPRGLELIPRPAYDGGGRGGGLREARHIWRAMASANAAAYIFRGGSTRLLIGAAFCGLRRRKLVFSAANDLDFEFERSDRSGPAQRLYRAALERADLVVVQSEQQRELALRALGGEPELIPSFAEPAEPAERGGSEPEAFLWIGRLVDYKRPLAFIELAQALPEASFRMVAIPTDETPTGLAGAVAEAGERLPNLEVLGKRPRTEVLELTGRAVAMVSTSAAEGMPNVFLEAWSRAVPVLSLDYDPDGRIESNGLGLVAGGDATRFAEQARSLWQDRARRDELGRAGLDYVRELHSPEAVGDRWAVALRGLLGP